LLKLACRQLPVVAGWRYFTISQAASWFAAVRHEFSHATSNCTKCFFAEMFCPAVHIFDTLMLLARPAVLSRKPITIDRHASRQAAAIA